MLAAKPYYYGRHIGPHDIAQRSKATALSYAAYADSLGVRFDRMPNTAKSEQIAAASILLKQAVVNADLENPPPERTQDCGFVLDVLKQYAFSFDEKTKLLSKVPVHNFTSHYADALMTYALYHVSDTRPRGSTRTLALQGRFDNPPRLKDILRAQDRPQRRPAFG